MGPPFKRPWPGWRPSSIVSPSFWGGGGKGGGEGRETRKEEGRWTLSDSHIQSNINFTEVSRGTRTSRVKVLLLPVHLSIAVVLIIACTPAHVTRQKVSHACHF